jgi:hypothetical protein
LIEVLHGIVALFLGDCLEDWMVPRFFLEVMAKTGLENGTLGVKSVTNNLVLFLGLEIARNRAMRNFVALEIVLCVE